MLENIVKKAKKVLAEISEHLETGIINFWLKNGVDRIWGGYHTCFDEQGRPTGEPDKYIVTQARIIWGFSALYRMYPENSNLLEAAGQGVDFFIRHFWDEEQGGWIWKVRENGDPVDTGKVVYGNAFAIYALAEHFLASGNKRSLEYAERTFELLQQYCTDTYHGGYYENLEFDWRISKGEAAAGDRKSLDVHMHLMEAFTTLTQASGKEIHKRKLQEVIDIILNKMIDRNGGFGKNQFDLEFNSIPAINIKRTWNAERLTGETISDPTDTTSYGHNMELVWLLNRAGEILEKPSDYYRFITVNFADYTIRYGLDRELGGIYRDGPHDGPALVRDKEWWQNCEALVGFLDAFEKSGDEKYFEAFYITWNFCKKYFINHELGEWRQLLDVKGNIISGDIGNPWKAIYHSGRAMLECRLRLEDIINKVTNDVL